MSDPIIIRQSTIADLQEAIELGYNHIHLSLQPADLRAYRPLKAQFANLHLRIWSAEPPPATFNTPNRAEQLLTTIDAAGYLGAKVLLLDPAHIFTDEDAFNDYLQKNSAPPVIDGFDAAWAQAANRRLTLALRPPLSATPTQMQGLCRDLALGYTLDMRQNNLEKWFAALPDRLAVAHLALNENTAATNNGHTLAMHLDLLQSLRRNRCLALILHGAPIHRSLFSD